MGWREWPSPLAPLPIRERGESLAMVGGTRGGGGTSQSTNLPPRCGGVRNSRCDSESTSWLLLPPGDAGIAYAGGVADLMRGDGWARRDEEPERPQLEAGPGPCRSKRAAAIPRTPRPYLRSVRVRDVHNALSVDGAIGVRRAGGFAVPHDTELRAADVSVCQVDTPGSAAEGRAIRPWVLRRTRGSGRIRRIALITDDPTDPPETGRHPIVQRRAGIPAAATMGIGGKEVGG
jgi:hypothetical protein